MTSKEGEGATFGLELPAGPAPATPRDAGDAGDAGGAGASPGESWAIDPGSENRTRPDDPDPPTNPFPPVNPDAAQNAGPDSAPGATEPTTSGPAGNPNTTDPTTSNPTTTDPKEPS